MTKSVVVLTTTDSFFNIDYTQLNSCHDLIEPFSGDLLPDFGSPEINRYLTEQRAAVPCCCHDPH
ncbi:hypothetical protein CD178_03244 (plasmid) [Komagataeibacter saccharivorans]|uniref:Uncharacterized protein n=1 Tax=Komagataeibacter saccharivorans TaxID=265959 RepID=A0A347WGJ5_9PROT|nr:hypothetical protein CD178_03244 [Komagataeibacter saccharivorans]